MFLLPNIISFYSKKKCPILNKKREIFLVDDNSYGRLFKKRRRKFPETIIYLHFFLDWLGK